jgi:hypothetical protein
MAANRDPIGVVRFAKALCSLVPMLVLLAVASASAAPVTPAQPHKLGSLVRMSDGFAVRVVSANARAWPVIRSQSRSNRPPRGGDSYVLVTIRATNLGKRPGLPFDGGVLEAVARSTAVYNPFGQGCGVIPSDVSNSDVVLPRKTTTVHACWEVATSDARSLVMVYVPYDGPGKTSFALR